MNRHTSVLLFVLSALALSPSLGCGGVWQDNHDACFAAQEAANDCEAEVGRSEDEWSNYSCDTEDGANYFSYTEWFCLEDAYLTANCSSEEGYSAIDVASCISN